MLQAERTAVCRGEAVNVLGVDGATFAVIRVISHRIHSSELRWIGIIKLTIIACILSIWADILYLPSRAHVFFI